MVDAARAQDVSAAELDFETLWAFVHTLVLGINEFEWIALFPYARAELATISETRTAIGRSPNES
jgi:hypothetical protein